MTTAIVVARGGSVRLPRKALLPFAGTTLIAHKVNQLHRCANIARVVVGSDDPEILAEAELAGAITIKRDAYHCDETRCSANEMIADMAASVLGDVIAWTHPTNPLVGSDVYDAALKAYMDAQPENDSLVSVTRVQRHCWTGGVPFNFDPKRDRHQPAAELPCLYFQDGAIFIQPRRQMLANRYFFAERPLLFEIDAVTGWDIDTKADYEACTRLYGANRQ